MQRDGPSSYKRIRFFSMVIIGIIKLHCYHLRRTFMSPSYDIAIQFKNISYNVGEISILSQITGLIYKGNVTTLVGPSGSGKTTLLKLCNNLISPTSGQLLIEGIPTNEYHPIALRRTVGIVLQNSPFIQGTVFHNLALPFQLQNKTLTKIEASTIIKTVGLDISFLDYQIADLSGGQKQKINIARTLLNKPNILLLDEITSALDPQSTREIESLIQGLNQKEGVTVIWITHSLEQAQRVGDFTWLLKNGQLLETGSSSEIINKLSNDLELFHSIGDKSP